MFEVFSWDWVLGCWQLCPQFPKMGLCLSRLPSTQKCGFLSTKLGGKWVCTAKYQIFLFKIEILSPKGPLSRLKKHKILLERILCEKYSALIDYFVRTRRFALILIIKNGLRRTQGCVCGTEKKKP